jgi:adenylate cyclase
MVALGWSVIFNSVQLYVQKRLYENSLALYLSPKLVQKFSGDPTLLKPGAQKQTLTLFFSDIEDFTRMSEGMDSDELASLMNQYFESAVTKCIH